MSLFVARELTPGAIEIVGEDGGKALVGERADRDGPGRDGFRPGGIETAEQPQDPEAGAESLLGMGSTAEHRDDEPLGVRPDRAGPAPEALGRPLGIAPMGTGHVLGIGTVPVSA